MKKYVPKIRRIGHIALYVKDPEASAKWYADVLGMTVVARADSGPYQGGVFMSFGTSDHDIGLFKRSPDATTGKEFEHVGMELDSNSDLNLLKQFYASLISHNVKVHEILNHGVSKGIYFFDPDGHMLEVFCQQLHGDSAMAELGHNKGMADPYALEPAR